MKAPGIARVSLLFIVYANFDCNRQNNVNMFILLQ